MKIDRCHRKYANNLLKELELRLRSKWKFPDSESEDWGYKNAASIFYIETGCPLKSARQYFKCIEDEEELLSLLGHKLSAKERRIYGRKIIRLP